MDILAALRQEEAKLKKQADIVRKQLDAVRAAVKILGHEVASSGQRVGKKTIETVIRALSTSFLHKQNYGARCCIQSVLRNVL